MKSDIKKPAGAFTEATRVVRHGQQFWHTHQALKQHDEAQYIQEMARVLLAKGRCATVADAYSVAAGSVTMYRSNEAGESVPQTARANLEATRERELAEKENEESARMAAAQAMKKAS